MSLRLTARVLLLQAVSVLACFLAFDFLVLGPAQEQARQAERAFLDEKSQALGVLAIEFMARPQSELSEKLRQAIDQEHERVLLFDLDGEALFDTDPSPTAHPDWPNSQGIQQASREGLAFEHARSSTSAEPRFCITRRLVGDETALGYLRLERSAGAFESGPALGEAAWLAAALAGLLALLLAFGSMRGVVRSTHEIRHSIDQLRAGNWQSRIRSAREDELGDLARSLDRLGEELTRHIAEVSGDEAQLRAMLAGMVEGVVGVDDDDCVVFSNRAARDLLGIEAEVGNGQRIWEFVRLPDLDVLIQEARKSNDAARRELVLVQEGRERVLGAQAHSFRSTHASGVVVVFDDFTELRRLERIRRDFVANVSHELKTPLTSIRGYVETLLDGALHDSANNERFLRKIQDNVMRLHHLVTDLLSLARIESQEGKVQLVAVDWRALLTQAVRRHEGDARRKGIDLRLEMTAGELRVLGDGESITQVIDNLLDNAIKYTPEGGRVTLALGRDGDQGVLEVRDTGIGIPHEDLERIFERFYRVDKARSRAVGGTGLGLSIVKHLVQAMQGSVSVESQAGRGSTFRVRLAIAPLRGELSGRRDLSEPLDERG